MRKVKNPFILYNATELSNLYLRESELSNLMAHVKGNKNIALYGRRGMGKSTLAKQFLLGLENTFDTLYVDLVSTQSKEEAIAAITIAIYQKFGKNKAELSPNFQAFFSQLGVCIDYHPYTGKPNISKGPKSFTMTERSLAAFGRFLSQRKKPVIIVLDEFQQISQYEEGNEEAVFRGWVQQFPALRFLFIGSPPRMMTDMFALKNRPFNKSAELVHLKSIPLEAYTDFIQNHFTQKGKSISVKLLSDIYSMARGETYTIQLLFHHIFAQSKTVKEVDLNNVLADILDQRQATYKDFSRMLTRNQWSLFKAISKEEPLYNPLSKDFVLKHQLGAVSTVSTALKALLKLGLVIEDDRAYLIHDVLLGKWMARLV